MEKHTVSHVLVLYFLLTKIMITRVESVVWLARIYLINLLEWKAHFSKIIPILQKHFYWCRFSEGCWSSGMQQGTLSNGEFIYLFIYYLGFLAGPHTITLRSVSVGANSV